MGLDFGNLLGAASKLQGAFGKENSLKKFMSTMSNFGIAVKNRFEVNFSGLGEAVFFIQDINLPALNQNFIEVNFDGKVVQLPTASEYEHDFSMTVLNDDSGYIYTALHNFVINDVGAALASSGYTMTVRSLGDGKKFKGMTITLNGVRIKNVGGLSYGHNQNDIQTFDVQARAIDFSVTPGAANKVSGVTGAIGSILG